MKQKQLQMMVIPGTIFLIIFSYIPMYGIIMAFQNYQIGETVGFSKWVGFANFIAFFNDPNFLLLMRNSIGISLLKLILGFPAPIILAILMNEVRGKFFTKFAQTASYLPHFISWVAVYGSLYTTILVDVDDYKVLPQKNYSALI